jgi:hypothetical protein
VALAELLSLWVALWLVYGTDARAEETETPARCEAVWLAPDERCRMQGVWAATGAGPNLSTAKGNALDRLAAAVAEGVAAINERIPLSALDVRACKTAAVEAARTTCFDEPGLTRKALCYIDLPGTGCGDVDMYERRGVVWKVMEAGRSRFCAKVVSATQSLGTEERHRCAARCKQEARVRCPG